MVVNILRPIPEGLHGNIPPNSFADRCGHRFSGVAERDQLRETEVPDRMEFQDSYSRRLSLPFPFASL